MKQRILILFAFILALGQVLATETYFNASLTSERTEPSVTQAGQVVASTVGFNNSNNGIEPCEPESPVVSNSTRPVDISMAGNAAAAILRPGDVDGDGEVNINDATTLIDVLLGGNASGTINGDVNGDGVVTVKDITQLIDMIMGADAVILYTTILVTTTDGLTVEYLIDENTRILFSNAKLMIKTDGIVFTSELKKIAQLRYGQREVSTVQILRKVDIPMAGTVFLHGSKENTLTEVKSTDGRVIMEEHGYGPFKVWLGNEPSGEYVVNTDSQTINIVKL